MNPTTLFSYAVRAVLSGRLRTVLTLIAIGVGAFSIFLLTGVSNGVREEVLATSTSLGNDLIVIVPAKLSGNAFFESRRQGFISFREKFTENDVKKVRSIAGIERAAGGLSSLAKMNVSGEELTVNLVGFQKDYEGLVPSVRVAEGRWFSSPKEVVLGHNVAYDLFSDRIRVGQTVYIEGRKYRVSGILQKTGNALARVDDRIIMDITEMRSLFPDQFERKEVTVIIAKSSEGYDVEEVGDQVKSLLSLSRGGDDTFTVVTPKFIKKQVDDIVAVLQAFFLSVASMALLIGLVGVSNTVYMNIIDRMREIAMLKALGALKLDVIYLFLIEGALLSLAGVLAGAAIAFPLGMLQPFVPFHPDIPLSLASTVVVVLAGVLASYFPAKHGASISPTEALRYE